MSGSGMLLILFLTYSKQEKNIVLMAQERAMETPRPDNDKSSPLEGEKSVTHLYTLLH